MPFFYHPGNANNLPSSTTPSQNNNPSTRSISPQSNASPIGSHFGQQPAHLHHNSSSGSLGGGSTTPTSSSAAALSQPPSLVSTFKSASSLTNGGGAPSITVAGAVIAGGVHLANAIEPVGVTVATSNMPGGIVTPGTPNTKAKVGETLFFF